MFLSVLLVLIFVITLFGGIVLLSDWNPVGLLLIIVAIATITCSIYCVFKYEKEHTTSVTEVVETKVTDKEVEAISNANGHIKRIYYVTVADGYILEVGKEQYAQLQMGDIVLVEVTTKTVSGIFPRTEVSVELLN